MCKVYGYARISTVKQSIERQQRNIIHAYPEAIILTEVYTGTKAEGRKEFEKLQRIVKNGDTIVFDSVSRMSRNATEGFELYQDFFNRGVDLVFIKEPQINTATYKQATERQIGGISTGDEMADELSRIHRAARQRHGVRRRGCIPSWADRG